MTFTQLTTRHKNFLLGWLLVLGLLERVECATVCVKSEVILVCTINFKKSTFDNTVHFRMICNFYITQGLKHFNRSQATSTDLKIINNYLAFILIHTKLMVSSMKITMNQSFNFSLTKFYQMLLVVGGKPFSYGNMVCRVFKGGLQNSKL